MDPETIERPESRPAARLPFLREWLRAPLQVAAIAPSGKQLSRLITSEITGQTGPVIELGPGTGVFTRQLLANGVAPADLTLVELNPSFSTTLRAEFPGVQVLNMGADRLAVDHVLDGRQAGAMVSGLGLLSMPKELVHDILSGVRAHLAPGASLYQFTYGWRCPVPEDVMADLGLQSRPIGSALANLPPATVYKITPQA